MNLLSGAFILATVAWTALSLYLSFRQSFHVLRHRDAPPADFQTSCSVPEHRKAADYARAREAVARWETLATSALAIAWALGGINFLYGLLANAIPFSIWRGVAFFLAAGFVGEIVSAPFDAYRTFRVEQLFGFNRGTPFRYVVDKAKRGLISLALATPLLFGLLFVMRELTGLWWLWAWLAMLAIMMAAPAIYIRLIAPRFNKFQPLPDGPLRARIETVLLRSGFRSSGLFTMDASRRTAHGNAYFVGFGKAKRIVLFDTLVARCTPEEIEAVVAHELGHFLHRHVLFALVRGAVILFVGLAAFGWLTKQSWLLPSFGVVYRDDALSLFVCLLLSSVVGPLLAPLSNWISRRNEYQADDYARRMVGVEPIAGALARLARDNASTLTPDPLYSLVHYSHPSAPLRVRALRAAQAAEGGTEPASVSAIL